MVFDLSDQTQEIHSHMDNHFFISIRICYESKSLGFSLKRANSETPKTFTTLNLTPGISRRCDLYAQIQQSVPHQFPRCNSSNNCSGQRLLSSSHFLSAEPEHTFRWQSWAARPPQHIRSSDDFASIN
ncbi:hypothetical protein AMTR_s00027p00231830 [Amborella trichopoda]|uniref:Uncharacterized protein n=1 Tax=Amborella trichopoda TaxID=13333 RepID=W1PU41_AMBTC|nr:hypothetical protein AMTR_s00027p00231830 [Amborella trichopoda]